MVLSFIVIALCAGFALATQAAINSQLAAALSGRPIVAALISFATGTLALLLICLWKTGLSDTWSHLSEQPWWKLIGGPLGALVVFTTIFLAPKMGITNMLYIKRHRYHMPFLSCITHKNGTELVLFQNAITF